MSGLTPELLAFLRVLAFAGAVVLLADVALLWVWVAGRPRGRPLLARRWSAAHVLVALQAWIGLTLIFATFGGAATALAGPRSIDLVILASLVAQNLAMLGVVLFTVLRIYDQLPVAVGLSLRGWAPRATIGLLVGHHDDFEEYAQPWTVLGLVPQNHGGELLGAGVVVPCGVVLERLSVVLLRHAPLPQQAAGFLSLVQRGVQEQYTQLLGIFSGPLGFAAALLLIGVIGPFGEEVFFRGFAYRCFRARWGRVAATLASAALFSLVHLHPLGLLPIFAVGCALAYLYERTGTLVAPFTLHAVNNIAAVLIAHFGHGR